MILLLTLLSVLNDITPQQRHAEREAELMAKRKVCEHLLGPASGCRFSGVGRSRNPKPKTCLPWEHGSPARKVVADAIVYRDGFYYRSTHWR